MMRDLTLIFSVFLAVVSLGFGVYKNIQATNAKGFAYEQAYRIMAVVQHADISASSKASIVNAALQALSTPPPVIDLSRSSADVPKSHACTEQKTAQCGALAADLADANAACVRAKNTGPDCVRARADRNQIVASACVACYTQ